MAKKQQVKRKKKALAQGRPPRAHTAPAALSSKATNKIINTHHQLRKQLTTAEANGTEEEAQELKKRIADLGGLKAYQRASIQGQASDRGGDSSIHLMEWLEGIKPELATMTLKVRMLEVGALSTKNACSKSGFFDIHRIDLFSETDGIMQQDFMERPVPRSEDEQFDIISLSLVLNFVPDPVGRGEILKRTCQFLDQRAPKTIPGKLQDTFPMLFLVLPAACIVNSRFMTEERLTTMMASLGYISLNRKQTAKLVYYLWVLRDKPVPNDFAKKEVNPGRDKNNFGIVIRY